jgi:hypothetical protein
VKQLSTFIIKERSIKETTPIPTIYDEESAKLRSEYYMETNPDHDDIIVKIKIFTTFNDQYFAHWRCPSNYIL